MASIVVDTSVFATIFKNEAGADRIEQAMMSADKVVVPAICLVEAALLTRIGKGFFTWVDHLIETNGFELSDVPIEAARLAADAARRYGKGSGHPARLNFGDCLAYAVAKHRDLPLLFVGDDFRHTDITPAIA